MASLFWNLTFTFTYISATLISAAFAAIVIYVAASLASFLIFYIKESIGNADRHPIDGTIFHQLIYFNTIHDYFLRSARKQRTFRLLKPSHSEIYTTDPANVEHMLKNAFTKYSKGVPNYTVMKDLLGDGIFAVDGDKWRQQRKLASFEFATKVLKDFSSVVFRQNAAKLATRISDAATAGASVDMQDLFMKSTLDSIFKVGFGVELDALGGSDEFSIQFSKAFDDSNQIIFWRFVDMFWKAKRYLKIGMEAKLTKNLEIIDDYVFKLIRRKRELMKNRSEEREKEDILSRFIIASEKEPETITDRYLRDIILNFLIAGKDTSANTLSWFFYMLCKNPLIQEKIAMEIKEKAVLMEHRDANIQVFASSLTDEVLERMHYLHAALTETLRLYPAVPLDGKNADEDDVFPDGFKVKKGDGVNYLAYAMGRMINIWGEDAEDFRPERWLDHDGTFRPESQFKFVAFNAGPRICLGKDFAYRQMKISAAALLHFFRFKLQDESKPVTYRTMFTLHVDKGLHLLASHRFS